MVKMPMDIARIIPLGDQILIHRLPRDDEQTKGGVIMPDACRRQFFKAEVLAVGPGQMDVGVHNPPDVTEGDVVIVAEDLSSVDPRAQHAPKHLLPVSLNEDDYYLVLSGHVYAIQLPEFQVDPERVLDPIPEPDDSEPESNLIGPDEPITDLEPSEETSDVNNA